MLSGGGILGSSDMVSEFVSMHAWSVIRSCCSFTLSPPPKDHLKGIVLAPLVLVLLILSPWRICLKGMQICESPAVYPIISLPCRSLSQSHHHDTFFLFIKWFHGAFIYWNIQLIYRNFNLLCKCFLAWIFREHVLPTIRSIFVLLVPNSQRTLCEFCGLNSWSKPQWTCMEGRYLILNNYFRLFSTSCFIMVFLFPLDVSK